MSTTKIQPLLTWRAALCDSGLKAVERHVALTLSLYMSERGDSAFPGAERLAHDTGLHATTVREKLGELVKAGWLEVVEKGGLKGDKRHANVYRCAVPPLAHGDPSPGTTRRPRLADPSPTAQLPLAHGDPISPMNSPMNSPTSTGTEIVPVRERKRSPRDDIFDALGAVFTSPQTKSAKSFYAKIAGELLEAGATPDEITRRGRALLAKDWPDAGPAALAKHWAALDHDARPENHRLLGGLAQVMQRNEVLDV